MLKKDEIIYSVMDSFYSDCAMPLFRLVEQASM